MADEVYYCSCTAQTPKGPCACNSTVGSPHAACNNCKNHSHVQPK